jgi:ABC-type lipoprotein release transport system permease subunit
MKFSDMFRMSLGNLYRRKVRSILTILGVVIGTASIVVMMSLGIGINYAFIEQLKSSGGLTLINVDNYGNGMADAAVAAGGLGKRTEELKLDDAAIAQIAALPHVSMATPILTQDVFVRYDRYESYLQLQGITLEAMHALQLPIKEGALPGPGEPLQLVVGGQIHKTFYNPSASPKEQEEIWSDPTKPDIDFMGRNLIGVYDIQAYYSAQSGYGTMPKKYLIPSACVLEATEGASDFSLYVDIEALRTLQNKLQKAKPTPSPTPGAGEGGEASSVVAFSLAKDPPNKEPGATGKARATYDAAMAQVSDMKYVKETMEAIRAMGFGANSNIEYIETMQQQSKQMQALLGGIGAVSLLVAAIGIANTMMMSIFERTREIGIMKVLGCALRNIRDMFLLEAAAIGLVGGILGVGLSYGLSAAINHFLGGRLTGANSLSVVTDAGANTVSVIPLWLALSALAFATLVGMVSGFYPAIRATRLSPLAAIRGE